MKQILKGSLEVLSHDCHLWGTNADGEAEHIRVLGPHFDDQYDDETGEYVQSMPDINEDCENDAEFCEAYEFELVDYNPIIFYGVSNDNLWTMIKSAIHVATQLEEIPFGYTWTNQDIHELRQFLRAAESIENAPWYPYRFSIMQRAVALLPVYEKWG